MRKKLIIISGFVLMMFLATTIIPAVVKSEEYIINTRTHIRAIGNFAICEEENILYGHIFVGLYGLQPVFNLDIEISQYNIKWIVMSGFSINGNRVYSCLNCVITE